MKLIHPWESNISILGRIRLGLHIDIMFFALGVFVTPYEISLALGPIRFYLEYR